jgi:hypothetical protein
MAGATLGFSGVTRTRGNLHLGAENPQVGVELTSS